MDDDELWAVYQQVVFIPIDKPPQVSHFMIITADYPQGRVLTEELRKQREVQLYETLKSYSEPRRLYGCSIDLKHRELSFAVANMTLDQTLGIARDYRQNAIYETRNNRLYLHACLITYQPKVNLGSFTDRIVTEN